MRLPNGTCLVTLKFRFGDDTAMYRFLLSTSSTITIQGACQIHQWQHDALTVSGIPLKYLCISFVLSLYGYLKRLDQPAFGTFSSYKLVLELTEIL